MNRRKFLAGLGAALATVAATTRLGQSTLNIASLPDGDFDIANLRYKATERYSTGWTDWRAVYGSSDRSYEETPVVYNGKRYEVAASALKDTIVDQEKVRKELFASKDSWFIKTDPEYLKKYHHRRIDLPFRL
jgi:hypothetical protein